MCISIKRSRGLGKGWRKTEEGMKDTSKQNRVQAPSLPFLPLCCVFTVKEGEEDQGFNGFDFTRRTGSPQRLQGFVLELALRNVWQKLSAAPSH